jgi:hypothetical protein
MPVLPLTTIKVKVSYASGRRRRSCVDGGRRKRVFREEREEELELKEKKLLRQIQSQKMASNVEFFIHEDGVIACGVKMRHLCSMWSTRRWDAASKFASSQREAEWQHLHPDQRGYQGKFLVGTDDGTVRIWSVFGNKR